MVVLRCTQKLLARLNHVGATSSVESTTRLGDWYGNILRIGHRQMLIFISERSRIPVIIPIREAKRRHLRVTATLGVLRSMAEQGLVNLPDLLERPKATSFYLSG